MLVALRATELLALLPSLLPSRIWDRGESRMLLFVLLFAVIETVGADIQAPATTRSAWLLPLLEVLPPSTKASASSRPTVRLRVAVDPASRSRFAACKVEPCTLVVVELPLSTWPEAEGVVLPGLRAVNAVLTVPPATSRPEEKSPWPVAVPVALIERLPRLITPPAAVIVTLGAVMVVTPATAVAPARVTSPELVREKLAGVAAAASQEGPVLVAWAPARIEP